MIFGSSSMEVKSRQATGGCIFPPCRIGRFLPDSKIIICELIKPNAMLKLAVLLLIVQLSAYRESCISAPDRGTGEE